MHPLVRLTFGEYQIASVTLAADAQALHDYSVEIYGDGIFPEGTTIAWATSFPTGHLLMWKQRRLIGEFGLAPLHPKDAENLLVATCWASDIIPMTEAEARLARPLYWYINGLSVHPDERNFRGFETLSLMLAMVLNNLVEDGLLTFPTTILTTAFSPEGERIIQHMNFSLVFDKATTGKTTLYRRDVATKNELFSPMARYGVNRWLKLLHTHQNRVP